MIDVMANRYDLDPDLVSAVVMTESSGKRDAVRFEAHWKYFYKPDHFAAELGIKPEDEYKNQATSWGLMQVMGSVAREMGHLGRLEDLLKPHVGLNLGCRKLHQCLKLERGDYVSALARYNGGSARRDEFGELEDRLQQYVDKVFSFHKELKTGPKGR
jgi:soluble lytic murein transglycosylase-like protein